MNLFREIEQALDNKSITNIDAVANKTIAMNIECFVAQYFLKNPNSNPKNLVLCYERSIEGYGNRIWIEEK